MVSVILGISAYYHDSAAAIIVNGEILAAAQEERFTRVKHDESFPRNAVEFVLNESGFTLDDVEIIAFYDKPYIKFERLIETYHAFAPKGLTSFLSAMPVWIKEKLFMKKLLKDELSRFGSKIPEIIFPEHHLSHAASAFFPSPFAEAAILTIDGVGEWSTTTIGRGKKNGITILKELHFPHSLGLLYSAFTYYCGFKVNSGEYKLMGLAPYGNTAPARVEKYREKILEELVDLREDGSFVLNMKYFNFATGLTMCNDKQWEQLFHLPKREPESDLVEPYANLALAAQEVTEEIVSRLAVTTKKITGCSNLVMAGGVALNCVANGKILKKNIFRNIWIQPAAGDAGGALGAALIGWHIWKNERREVKNNIDLMNGAFLGPAYSTGDIEKVLRKYEAASLYFDDFDDLSAEVSKLIAAGHVTGWFQGRMEFGPRALGNRSILGDPRNPDMQKTINMKIKYREGFRPFAPSVLQEDMRDYFDLDQESPYMLFVAPVKNTKRNPEPENYKSLGMRERLYHLRSDVPAITHIDYSARIQSISKDVNPYFWKLLHAFKKLTGYSVLINTSFNVRGEPIVNTPEDAYLCFMRTEMDYLVMGNYLLNKKDQKKLSKEKDWKKLYTLD